MSLQCSESEDKSSIAFESKTAIRRQSATMSQLISALLFAALASAQTADQTTTASAPASAQTANYTTTAWMTNYAGSDKFGYVASVIGADAEHMTLALDFDSDTDLDALHIGGPAVNYTFGRSSFTLDETITRYANAPSGDMFIRAACTEPAQSESEVQCTVTQGDAYVRMFQCNEDQTTRSRQPRTNRTTSYPHTYGTGIWGPAGTETITMTYDFPAQTETTTPAWCTSDNVPESVLTTPFPRAASSFAVYQIVIYAGQEKLSAYSGSSVVISTATPSTGSVPGATASAGNSDSASASATVSAPPENTGAAGRINAAVPAVAGVAVAAVLGML